MIYFDSNYIVRCYLREEGAAEVLKWHKDRRAFPPLSMESLRFYQPSIGITVRKK